MGHDMEKIGKFRIIFAKYFEEPEGRRQRRRLIRRGECNIKMDVKEVGFGDWTELFCFSVGTNGGLLCPR